MWQVTEFIKGLEIRTLGTSFGLSGLIRIPLKDILEMLNQRLYPVGFLSKSQRLTCQKNT